MRATVTTFGERWDWRISGQLRLVSLASIWAMVFAASALAPIMPAVGAARMAFGGGQLVLNTRLAKKSPLAPRDRWDWLLLVAAVFGSMVPAAFAGAMASPGAALLFLPVLIPYSVLQLRAFGRSMAAARADRKRTGHVPVSSTPGMARRAA